VDPEQPVRVLVIEDNPDTAETLRFLLEHKGHEVAVAHTGPAGVLTATLWAPDAVVCDLRLPDLDGWGVAQALRGHPVTRSSRLIAFSGHNTEADRERSRQAGFDQHLAKAADPEELLRLLAPSSTRPARVKTLLLVEDNEVIREGMAVLLRREGYEVVLAADGQEGLTLLDAEPRPDLVLLDMLLPRLDGWEFLERAGGRSSPPAILLMTGTCLSREWAESHACRGFLRKPVEVDELLEEVRRCLAG
jgi:CheY-like chemotaxis protein